MYMLFILKMYLNKWTIFHMVIFGVILKKKILKKPCHGNAYYFENLTDFVSMAFYLISELKVLQPVFVLEK